MWQHHKPNIPSGQIEETQQQGTDFLLSAHRNCSRIDHVMTQENVSINFKKLEKKIAQRASSLTTRERS